VIRMRRHNQAIRGLKEGRPRREPNARPTAQEAVSGQAAACRNPAQQWCAFPVSDRESQTSRASVLQPVQLVRQGFGDGTDAAV
jgi:hypothetical protein